LRQQDIGNHEWTDRVKAKGFIWATPGPYLRKSMLLILAKRIGDNFLPEAFYSSLFTDAEGSPQLSPEEEEDAAMSLDHKIQDTMGQLAIKATGVDEPEDDDSEIDE
jgi:hypothetical protein